MRIQISIDVVPPRGSTGEQAVPAAHTRLKYMVETGEGGTPMPPLAANETRRAVD
jgi:hypothetical protein